MRPALHDSPRGFPAAADLRYSATRAPRNAEFLSVRAADIYVRVHVDGFVLTPAPGSAVGLVVGAMLVNPRPRRLRI